MIVGKGMALAALGMVLGVAGSLALGRIMSNILFQTSVLRITLQEDCEARACILEGGEVRVSIPPEVCELPVELDGPGGVTLLLVQFSQFAVRQDPERLSLVIQGRGIHEIELAADRLVTVAVSQKRESQRFPGGRLVELGGDLYRFEGAPGFPAGEGDFSLEQVVTGLVSSVAAVH